MIINNRDNPPPTQHSNYIQDLKSETWVEIVNNLHGQDKSCKKLTVYALVEDTPTKQLGEELEKLIHSDQTTNNEPKKTPNKAPNTHPSSLRNPQAPWTFPL